MRAGRLRHRLTIQQRNETQGATGEVVLTWTTYATVWGAVEPVSGRELLAGDRVAAEASVRVLVRYLSGVTTRHRVLFGSRLLEIVAVIDRDERHVELELLCNEAA